jgi:TolB-like protein
VGVRVDAGGHQSDGERRGRRARPTQAGARLYDDIGLVVVALAYFIIDNSARRGGTATEADRASIAAGDVGLASAGTAAERAPTPHSVAMLPFANLSPNPDDEYFAAGIHEQVLTRLGKIGDLTVIARQSVLRYVDSGLSIPAIARELNVEAIGGGSVRYADDNVRVTAYLIDVATEAQLWSETYTRPFENIFAIETEIATQIAAALEAELAPSEQRSLEKQSTDSGAAYALYLRAIAAVGYSAGGLGVSPPEAAEFHRYLDRALELDPEFALGYAAKARDYAYSMGRMMPRSAGLSAEDRALLAVANAEKALALDPETGLAYAALAVVHRFNWREREARLALDRALELSPNDYQVLFDAAVLNTYTGNEAAAIDLARRAAGINPVEGFLPLGVAFLWTGDYDAAAEQFTPRLDLGRRGTPYLLAQIELLRGNRAAALGHLPQAEKLGIQSPTTIPSAAYLYHELGADAEAEHLLATLEGFAADYAVGPGDWALAALSRGNDTEALQWLQQAAARRSAGSDWQSLFLIVQNLYSDPVLERPEFVEVRDRLGWQ